MPLKRVRHVKDNKSEKSDDSILRPENDNVGGALEEC